MDSKIRSILVCIYRTSKWNFILLKFFPLIMKREMRILRAIKILCHTISYPRRGYVIMYTMDDSWKIFQNLVQQKEIQFSTSVIHEMNYTELYYLSISSITAETILLSPSSTRFHRFLDCNTFS